jgi:hypothetical protein
MRKLKNATICLFNFAMMTFAYGVIELQNVACKDFFVGSFLKA